MNCGSCRHDNEPNAKFCSECGAPLALRCPGCDAEQPSGSKFCNQCGTAMAATTAPPAPGNAAVRKNVTALFADLVGSTSFGEQVDPEAARASMAGYFEILRSTIEDHAGTVVKFTGDGVMAVFGVPEVAEDDALRAVAAGQALQGRFRAFADQVRERHGVELGLRVGVNTGELVVGEDDADMVGDVLNTAARLEAACQPGRVMVGEDTWRLTRSSITYEVLGEVRVKGKADALATFQVVDGEHQSAEDVTPFVGRQDELAQLHTVFGDAVASSMARLATVIGAPGVGKTRLASELRAAADVRSFDLRFERRGSTTFTPIVELLRELTGSGTAEDVERLVAEHPEAARLAPVLASFLGHGQARSTEESFWAVRRLLELLARDAPLIVVVDDIQWAEPLFWDLLDHLVEWTEAPVLLVALARPELRELRPELAQVGRRVAASISVEGLDAATTRELAARLLDTDELPGDLIDRLPDSTEGNPLFVRELVQMLVDDGVLARTGDHWHLTIDVDAIEVPPTILSLLASRVERLPDDERQVVELASVIGTEFDRGTLGAIAGGEIATKLGALIDRLRRKDLIEPSGSWAGDHPVYRFHHVLVRDAAYRRLLKGHRADLHEQVGRHVEGLSDVTDELDVVIAFHYEQVHGYRSELGTVDDGTLELAAQATRRLRSAAEQALAREDLPSAGGYALRALALVPADAGAQRDELLLLGCEALLSSGDVARGAELVGEMGVRASDERLAAWAECFRAQLWSLTDPERLTEASEITDAAATRLAELGDDSGVAKARLVRAGCLARLGRIGDCEEELDLALGAARAAGDRRRTVAVLGNAPLAALWGPSPVARAGGRCLDVLRLLRITTASPAVEATSIRCQGMLEALRGRFDSARAKFETSRTTARELGLRQGLYETELFAGFVELLAGDPIAAEPHLRAAQEGLGRQGIATDAGQASARLARSLLRQGRIDEADGFAAAALETAGQNPQTAIASRAVLAEIRAEQGKAEEAERLIVEAIEIAEQTDLVLDHALTLLAAVRVADAAGAGPLAAARAEAARILLEQKGVTVETLTAAATPTAPTVSPHEPNEPDQDDTFTNRAWELQLRAAKSYGRPELRTLLSDQFESREHTRIRLDDAPMTADQFVELMVAGTDLRGDVSSTPELLATRDDDLCLSKLVLRNGDDERISLCITRCEGQLAVSVDWYDEDQLAAALDELDRQWIELGGSESQARVGARIREAFVRRDGAALRACVSDDMLSVDHRRGGFMDRNADEWAASMQPIYDADDPVIPICRTFAAQDDRHGLYLLGLEASDGSTWDIWTLQTVVGDVMTATEMFDLDQFDLALSRFHELTGGSRATALANTAWRVMESLVSALAAGDQDHARNLMHQDYSSESRARYAAGDGRTIDDVLAAWDPVIEQRGIFEARPLAVRGDDLCLVHSTIDAAGDRSERYGVFRTEGGLARSGVWFDTDQLLDAHDELNRQWVVLGGPPGLMKAVTSLVHAIADGDIEQLHRLVSDDFVSVDHRQSGLLGHRDADTWVRTMSELMSAEMAMHAVIAHSDRHLVGRGSTRFDGGRSEWDALLVLGTDAEGHLTRWDLFSPDQSEAAMALFEQLTRPRPEHTRRELTNHGWELSQRTGEAFASADRETLPSLYTEDYVGVLHEPWRTIDSLDREAHIDMMDRALDGVDFQSDVLAVRGQQLYLASGTLDLGESVVEVLYLGESRGDQTARADWYSQDQLDEAIAELDRRYLESLGFGGEHWITRLWPAVYASDPETLVPALHPDWEYVEHRQLTYASTDVSGFNEILEARHYDLQVVIPCVHALSESGIVYERQEIAVGELGEYEVVVVSEFLGESVRRTDAYEIDDLDAALARYDELTADPADPADRPGLANAASELLTQLRAPIESGDRGRARAILHPEAEIEFRMRFAGGQRLSGDEWIDNLALIRSQGLETSTHVLAVRGSNLALVSARFDSETTGSERYVVIQAGDGVLTAVISFDGEQFDEALAELDRRYLDSLGFGADHWIAERWRVMYAYDPDAMAPYMHPAFEYVEHRSLAFADTDGSGLLAIMQTLEVEVEIEMPAVDRLSERGMVFRRLERATDNTHETRFAAVLEFDDSLVRRFDIYEPEDLDAALARYDEIMAAAPSRSVVTNRAERASRETITLVAGDGLAAHRHRFSPDFVQENRRRRGLPAMHDASETAEVMEWTRQQGVFEVEADAIAVRGDTLCLQRWFFTFENGDEFEQLMLSELDDEGRVAVGIAYDVDQVVEAQIELDRRWVELGGPEVFVDSMERVSGALANGEREAIRACITDDFVAIDHRQLGLGLRRADEWAESMAALGQGTQLIVTDVVIHDGDTFLIRSQMRRPQDGAEWNFVHAASIEGGLFSRIEVFTPDQIDQARAVYEQLTAADTGVASSSRPTLGNSAWVSVQAYRDALVEGDRRRFIELMTPDCLAIARYRLNVGQQLGPEQFADSVFAQRSLGEYRQEIELIAIRGDELCLVRTRLFVDENLMEYLIVGRSDGDRLARMVMFDETQFQDAFDELDRQWVELGGPADKVATFEQMRAAVAAGDPPAVRALLTDDFVEVDHRPLGMGVRTADEWVSSLPTTLGEATLGGSLTMHLVSSVADADTVWLGRYRMGGANAEWPDLLGLVQFRDGLIARLENFPLNQLDAAKARFDELTASSATTTAIVVSNHASHLFDRCCQAAVDVGTEAHLSHFHADFEFEARRASAHHHVGGRAEWREAARFWFDETEVGRVDNDTIAIRGERLTLGRVTMVSDTGDEWGFVYVAEVDDGTIRHLVSFDDAQLDEALDELDRQWVELGAPALAARRARQVARTLSSGPHDEFSALFAAGFEVVDHRPLGLGTRTRDEFLTSAEVLVGRVDAWTANVFEADDQATLTRVEMRSAEGDLAWTLLLITIYDGDLVTRWEQFAVDDFDAALARYDELLRASRSTTPVLTNRAAELGRAFSAAWTAGSFDLAEFVEPDLVFAGRRSSTPTIDGGIEVLESILEFWTGQGLQRQDVAIVAIRGDDLDLSRLRTVTNDGDELTMLFVSQLGPSGRFASCAVYDPDQIVEAQIELDRRWLESLGFGPDHFLHRIMPHAYDMDPDDIAPVWHPELEYVEHRRLLWQGGDRDRLHEIMASVAHDVEVTIPRIHRISARGAVYERVETATAEFAESRFVGVTLFEDGLVKRGEIFDPDDLDAALALYDALTSEAPAATPPQELVASVSDSMRNRVVAAIDQIAAREVRTGDPVEALAAQLADVFEFRGRRRTAPHFDAGREHLVTTHRTWRELGLTDEGLPELVAVRGDDLLLVRSGVAGDEGRLDFLILVETGPDLLIRRWTVFDDDQLAEALDELDQRWVELGAS